jgi:ABC-type nickel/cobalt efflux system permease component RcnA
LLGEKALWLPQALVMTFGTAVTISGLAVLARLSRDPALHIALARTAWQARFHYSLAVLSSLLVYP